MAFNIPKSMISKSKGPLASKIREVAEKKGVSFNTSSPSTSTKNMTKNNTMQKSKTKTSKMR